jgi:nickel/cobalt transporter (NicO) family protein
MVWKFFIEALVGLQRDIYAAVADHLRTFAADRNWLALLAVLPMGVVFGAAHASTPGHSKTVLAAYVTGSRIQLSRGLLMSLVLSFTHVTMAVLIAVLALPLISIALGSVGRAPLLEDVSRGLLGLIGVWMVWRALRGAHRHRTHEGEAVGVMAGLIPCPLTLFVMTFAMARGIPLGGLIFAAAMMLGVALTLCVVAAIAVAFRNGSTTVLEKLGSNAAGIGRVLEIVTGSVLVIIALRELFGR